MGHKVSKTVTDYYKPDALFIDKGCIGLTRNAYDNQRLYSAPFYNVKILAKTYFDLVNQIIQVFRNPPPMASIDSTRELPSPPQIYGPVYLFTAYDAELKVIEACLLFPSMHKDRNVWVNYFELGIYHRWMGRLVNKQLYNVNPVGGCQIHVDQVPDIITHIDSQGNVTYESPYARFVNPIDKLYYNNPWYTISTDKATGHQTYKRAQDPYPVNVVTHGGPTVFNTRTTVTTRTIPDHEPSNMIYGCRTLSSARCMQSDNTHKAMGIFRSGKKPSEYPSAYFHMYQVNQSDNRVSSYFASNTSSSLVQNILPEYLDMANGCHYILVSPNGNAVFGLGITRIGIYKKASSQQDMDSAIQQNVDSIMQTYKSMNFSQDKLDRIRAALTKYMQQNTNICGVPRYPSFERRFQGNIGVRAIIEDNILNVYSKKTSTGDEFVVFSLPVAAENIAHPIALVLDDSGALSVYDRNNTQYVLIDANGNYTNPLQDGQGGTAGAWFGNGELSSPGFDKAVDFRKRLYNLKVYLKLIDDIVNNQIGITNAAAFNPSDDLLTNIGEYDENVDYVARYDALLEYLYNNGMIDHQTYSSHYMYPPKEEAGSTATTSTAIPLTLPGLDGTPTTADDVLDTLNVMLSVVEMSEPDTSDNDKRTADATAADKQNQDTAKKSQSQQDDLADAISSGLLDTTLPLGDAPFFRMTAVPSTTGSLFAPDNQAATSDSNASSSASASAASYAPGWDTHAEYVSRMYSDFNVRSS
jgi:hypothetical protein